MSKQSLDLIQRILCIFEEQRITLQQIRQHVWFQRPNQLLCDGKCSDPVRLATRLMAGLIVDDGTQQVEATLTQAQQQQIQEFETYVDGEPMYSSLFSDRNDQQVDYAFTQPMQYHVTSTQDVRPRVLETSFSQPVQDWMTVSNLYPLSLDCQIVDTGCRQYATSVFPFDSILLHQRNS